MDAPTLEWLRFNIAPEEVRGKRVLEVGSLDVNGSIRPFLEQWSPREYWGVDLEAGPGVDQVLSVHDLKRTFRGESFDVVISTEMLEHVENWRSAVWQMVSVLKTGGLLVITTRRPGFPRHNHPHDWWRFTGRTLQAALGGFDEVRVSELAGCGVAIRVRKPLEYPGEPWELVEPEPAPNEDWPWWRWRVWAFFAYRGRDPAARRPERVQSPGMGPCP